jgi:hypothetical protein
MVPAKPRVQLLLVECQVFQAPTDLLTGHDSPCQKHSLRTANRLDAQHLTVTLRVYSTWPTSPARARPVMQLQDV